MKRDLNNNNYYDIRSVVSTNQNASTTPPVILHVDDDPEFLELTELMFNRFADTTKFIHETDPEAAINIIQENTAIDGILLDYNMPGKTGVDIAIEVVGDTEAPLILYTAQKNSFFEDDVHERMDDVLQKPCISHEYKLVVEYIRDLVEAPSPSDESVS